MADVSQAQFYELGMNYLLNDFPSKLLALDSTAIIVAVVVLAISAIILAVVFGLGMLVHMFVKRFFLFVVILIFLAIFINNFQDKLFTPNPDSLILLVGVIGILVGIAAFLVSFLSLSRHAKQLRVSVSQNGTAESAPEVTPSKIQLPEILTLQAFSPESIAKSVKNERSILAVISYVIIAQFGVFSGITISAPNPQVGMAFSLAFFVGAFIFIKTTYKDYFTGVRHLTVASFFSVALSMALGHFWAEIPLSVLLSIDYFATPAAVAFVTGIAISLLMGYKN